MDSTISEQIVRECQKLIARHHANIRQNIRYQDKYQRRTGESASRPESYEPSYWSLDPHFNPFHVRARADAIANSIARRIRDRTYVPKPALTLQIPKPTGGTRGITIFPIADAAVSNYLFKTLRGRNQQFLSSYAYAYRGDRSVHHAVEHLFHYVKDTKRAYVLNYDFSKYFDSIDHEYLRNILALRFRLSEKERSALQGFLTYRKAESVSAYQSGQFIVNNLGVPQGSSISLFLANVACLELDLEIEREGAVFARYADDTIILCNSYEVAHRCANRMMAHGRRSRTQINFEKSEGIFLLTREPRAEMRSTTHFDFLGNRISQIDLSIASKSVRRIKKKISAIVHRHLLLYPGRGLFSANRVSNELVDWDLVTCLNEIRRYLYGQVTEQNVTECLRDYSAPLVMTKSLLSFYPLVSNPKQFQDLDGWLLNILKRAQKRRRSLIEPFVPGYRLYSKQEFLTGSWYVSDIPNETRVPSFFRAWSYVRKLLNVFGVSRFPVPDYES
jgi:RNA-directed DNA polymerase